MQRVFNGSTPKTGGNSALLGDMTLEHSLRAHPFTFGLPEDQMRELAGLASRAAFAPDEVVIADGQRSKACYLLLDGSVAVELSTPRLTVCVQVVGAGGMFGWSAFLEEQDTLFQVRARERTTVLRLDGERLAAACYAQPEMAAELLRRTLRVVAGRVKATEAIFAQFCGVKV